MQRCRARLCRHCAVTFSHCGEHCTEHVHAPVMDRFIIKKRKREKVKVLTTVSVQESDSRVSILLCLIRPTSLCSWLVGHKRPLTLPQVWARVWLPHGAHGGGRKGNEKQEKGFDDGRREQELIQKSLGDAFDPPTRIRLWGGYHLTAIIAITLYAQYFCSFCFTQNKCRRHH